MTRSSSVPRQSKQIYHSIGLSSMHPPPLSDALRVAHAPLRLLQPRKPRRVPQLFWLKGSRSPSGFLAAAHIFWFRLDQKPLTLRRERHASFLGRISRRHEPRTSYQLTCQLFGKAHTTVEAVPSLGP